MQNQAFQSTVQTGIAAGVQGDFWDSNYNHMYPLTPVADNNGVTVGAFVWDNGDGTCSATGSGKPTGVVHRTLDNPMFTLDAYSMAIPAGFKVPITDTGSVILKVTTAPSVGQKIFVNNTTGAISTAAAGSSVSGSTETDFVVRTLFGQTSAANIIVGASWYPSQGSVDLSGYATTSAVETALAGKQDVLTSENAGTGISISSDEQGVVTIAATGQGG